MCRKRRSSSKAITNRLQLLTELGNRPWSQASHVPFSTVEYDFETIVEKAVAIIERVRNEGETDNTPLLVKPNLFIREPNHEAA
jgi:DNA-binding LacI/PurR family transcriptional regulator